MPETNLAGKTRKRAGVLEQEPNTGKPSRRESALSGNDRAIAEGAAGNLLEHVSQNEGKPALRDDAPF
jgi:hypothetical protein